MTFTPCVPGTPGIQINVPAIYPNALPLNIAPSSIPRTLSTNDTMKHKCGRTESFHLLLVNNRNPCLGLCCIL